ncbi:hypothetical protein V5799_028116, partial [Amblyomma americanum]
MRLETSSACASPVNTKQEQAVIKTTINGHDTDSGSSVRDDCCSSSASEAKKPTPVLVTDVSKNLNMSLWQPDGLCRDFGEIRNDLVNCRTDNVLPNQPMRKFWEGFEKFSKHMKDQDGEYMLLKLKDWPAGDDFSDMLPSRFNDLIEVLPLPEYTHREGVFNLAGRLPECFVRPDLGPKMYNAYGSALYPDKGTTNLHLDVSDAVNVMVYMRIPKDGKDEEHIK